METRITSCRKCAEYDLLCSGELKGCFHCALSGSPCSYSVSISFNCQNLDTLEIPITEDEPWDEDQHIKSIIKPLSVLPNATQFERDAIFHFLQGTSPTLVAMEVPHDNPNYTYFPISLNSSSKALYYALCAAGGGHLKNWGGNVDWAKIKHAERKSITILERDVQELAKAMLQPASSVSDGELRERVSSILAVLQTLILYATTIGDVKQWRKHLQGASVIIQAASNPGRGRSPVLFDTFLLETLRYLDLLSALAWKSGTTIPSNTIESGWQPSQTVVVSSVTGMHGFSKPLLEIVVRICDLQKSLTDPSFPSSSVDSLVSSIQHDLESYRHRMATLETDPQFRFALLKRLSLSDHSEQLDGHFRFTEAVYFACHVHLCRTISGLAKLDEKGREYVYEGLRNVTKIPMEGSAGNLLGWALVVLGVELENDDAARAIVRERMSALASLGHLNLYQAGQLVEEVWKRKDQSKDRETIVSWQDTMQELGWDLLVA